MSRKAKHSSEVKQLTDIPNIGVSIAGDLRGIGIHQPRQLIGKNGFDLYRQLCEKTGIRHDPCVIDTFLAAVDFMNGGEAKPWWAFTEFRKKTLLKSK